MPQSDMGAMFGKTSSEEVEKLIETPAAETRLNGMFLPLTYALNEKNDKHVTIAVTGDGKEYAAGVVFTATPNKRVALTYHVWNILRGNLDYVQIALDKKNKISFILKDITDSDVSSTVIVKQIFGNWYVQVMDTSKNRLSLTAKEWYRFTLFVPSMSRYLTHLWRDENLIVDFLNSDAKFYPHHSDHWWIDQLVDEKHAYKALDAATTDSVGSLNGSSKDGTTTV